MSAKPWDEQDQDERAATVARARRAGKRHPHAAWSAMVDVVRKGSLLECYEADFWVHDRASLAREAGKRDGRSFVWGVGKTGTLLVWEGCPGVNVSWFDDRPCAYAWDGRALRPVGYEDAIAFLADEARLRAVEAAS